MRRKEKIFSGQIYHIFNRSIGKTTTFKEPQEYLRMTNLLIYYTNSGSKIKFSDFINLVENQEDFISKLASLPAIKPASINIIAYCLMPNHFHLILKQLTDNGISGFITQILDSYSKYFNKKYERNGPLWEGRFKNVLVNSDEQLLYLSSYIHLNPVRAKLANHPKDWPYSSYQEYISLYGQDYARYVESFITHPGGGQNGHF